MRLSVRRDDPGYNFYLARNCSIFVYGEDITEACHTADEEKGMVWCYKRNAEGNKYVEGDRVAEIVMQGKVEIEVHEHNGVAT